MDLFFAIKCCMNLWHFFFAIRHSQFYTDVWHGNKKTQELI
jgi:hypothetical protein